MSKIGYVFDHQNGPFRFYRYQSSDPNNHYDLAAMRIGDISRLRKYNPVVDIDDEYNAIYADSHLIRLFEINHLHYCYHRFCRGQSEIQAVRNIKSWFRMMAGCHPGAGYHETSQGSSIYIIDRWSVK